MSTHHTFGMEEEPRGVLVLQVVLVLVREADLVLLLLVHVFDPGRVKERGNGDQAADEPHHANHHGNCRLGTEFEILDSPEKYKRRGA